MTFPKIPLMERLVAYTSFTPDADGCWDCMLSPQGSGYVQITEEVAGQQVKYTVHRYVWEKVYGPVPDGKLVLHRCDNRRCWRPSHLFLGTTQDNTADRHAKGRDARGSGHGRAILTSTEVEAIRLRYKQGGASYRILAEGYGVTKENIRAIVKGWTWKHG